MSQRARRLPSSRQSVLVYEDKSRASQQNETPMSLQQSTGRHALPFRPCPAHPPQLEHRDESYVGHGRHSEQHALIQTSHNGFHSVQPIAQLSLRSPQRHRAPVNRNFDSRTVTQPREYGPRQADPREPGNEAIIHHQARQPLEQVSASYLNRQPPVSSRARNLPATPLSYGQSRPPVASVLSPFFRHGIASRVISTQHPAVAGASFGSHQPISSRESPTAYSMAPPRRGIAHSTNQQAHPSSSSFSRRPIGHQLQDQSQSRNIMSANGYRRGSALPQTPRRSQGLSQRPDHSVPTSNHAPSQLLSNAQRGRISFPPSQQPSSAAGNQEQALSQIRGVRGMGPQPTRPLQYESGLLHDPVRTLYSSAGSRRSVCR